MKVLSSVGFVLMYMTINNCIGQKRIDLSCLIRSKEVTVVSVLSDNIRYEFTEHWTIELESRIKRVMAGTYTRRELINLAEGKIEVSSLIIILE